MTRSLLLTIGMVGQDLGDIAFDDVFDPFGVCVEFETEHIGGFW
jgi:hypothetical protein